MPLEAAGLKMPPAALVEAKLLPDLKSRACQTDFVKLLGLIEESKANVIWLEARGAECIRWSAFEVAHLAAGGSVFTLL